MNNLPFDHAVAKVARLLDSGFHIQQQFTCTSCRNRNTVEQRDTLFTLGVCAKCGEVTDLKKNGCGFTAEISR